MTRSFQLDSKNRVDSNFLSAPECYKKNVPEYSNKEILEYSGTSVPSEEIFSMAGRIIPERRARLTGEKVKMLVFCKKNIDYWDKS